MNLDETLEPTAYGAMIATRALHWYCADYYDGQWDDLYRILCELGYAPGAFEKRPKLGEEEYEVYRSLVHGWIEPRVVLEWIDAREGPPA